MNMMINFIKKFKIWLVGLFIIPIAFAATSIDIEKEVIEAPIVEKPIVAEVKETYFAELDKNNEVIRVIVADQDFINSGAVGSSSNWIQTYKDNNVRKNYAGIGRKYNEKIDAFISKKPTIDATLDVDTAKWIIPKTIIEKIDNNIATSTK